MLRIKGVFWVVIMPIYQEDNTFQIQDRGSCAQAMPAIPSDFFIFLRIFILCDSVLSLALCLAL